MLRSLTKSIALASALCGSPSTLAFTTPSLQRSTHSRPSSSSSPPRSSLRASAAGEESGNSRPPPLTSSSSSSQQRQEERLDGGDDIDFPLPTADSNAPFSELDDALDDEPRSSEFRGLEPRPASPARLSRLDSEARSRDVYVPSGSDRYWDLRDEIAQLETDLRNAIEVGVADAAVDSIRALLRRARAKDPMHVYKVIGEAAESAEARGDEEKGRKYREESSRARNMLPQFNLEGLWVGKYGSHGFEMINVTYSGDQLIAYKVTGDKNIPRGEISFTADLSPRDGANSYASDQQPLDPIQLSESSAKKWGTRRLPRFRGQGHAAEPGFVNHQFMEGQLVVIGGGDYFSFAWVPLEHQIFFGRPSPELTLKMLREGGGSSLTAGVGLDVPGLEAGTREQADYVERCLEVTADAQWDEYNEGKVDEYSCIWHGDEDHCYFE